jgi:hypothetical protein
MGARASSGSAERHPDPKNTADLITGFRECLPWGLREFTRSFGKWGPPQGQYLGRRAPDWTHQGGILKMKDWNLHYHRGWYDLTGTDQPTIQVA